MLYIVDFHIKKSHSLSLINRNRYGMIPKQVFIYFIKTRFLQALERHIWIIIFTIIFYFKLLLTGHLNQTKLLTFLQLVRRRAENSLQMPTYRPAPLGKCRSHYHWWCKSCCSTLHKTILFSPSIPAKIGRVHYWYANLNTEDEICELHTDFT